MKRATGLLIVLLSLCAVVSAGQFRLEVSAPKADCLDVPISYEVKLPEEFKDVQGKNISVVIEQTGKSGSNLPGQIIKSSDGKAQLYWVAPSLKAGQRSVWVAKLKKSRAPRGEVFSWNGKRGEYLDLLFDGKKVTRYMMALDKSTPKRLHETYKVFHHVFDADGENLLTKGPDGETPYEQGTYTHHRGVYIGWNKLKVEGQQYDFWHMKDVFLVHKDFSEMIAGPVLGSSTSTIDWIDKKGEPVISEERQVTVFRQSDPTILLLEFQTNLKAVKDDVILDGDPEHAGFQYRPHNDVAAGKKDVKAAYLFHKDGIDAHKDGNLPWVAMSYGLNGKRYSVLHMNHPDNPTPSVYSAYRDYGRFGTFFKDKIAKGETLSLKYRILVKQGQMPLRQEWVGKYLSFIDGPKVDICDWKQ